MDEELVIVIEEEAMVEALATHELALATKEVVVEMSTLAFEEV